MTGQLPRHERHMQEPLRLENDLVGSLHEIAGGVFWGHFLDFPLIIASTNTASAQTRTPAIKLRT